MDWFSSWMGLAILPAGRLRRFFPPTGQPLTLHLTLPAYREGQMNVTRPIDGDPRTDVRFREVLEPMSDFNTGQDSKQVAVLEHNLRLAVDREIGPHDVSMPVARILMNGLGAVRPGPRLGAALPASLGESSTAIPDGTPA